MADFSAKIYAELDTSHVPNQLKDITKKYPLVLNKFVLNTKGLPQQIQASLDGHKFQISLDGIKMTNIDSQAQAAGAKTGQAFSAALTNRINSQLNNGGFTASIARVTAQYEKLGTTGHANLGKIKTDIEELNRLQGVMQTAGDSTTLVTSYQKYNEVLTRVKNNIVTVSAESQNLISITQRIANLDNSIAAWMGKNSAASKQFGAEIQNLRAKLSQLQTSGNATEGELKDVENAFKGIKLEAQAAGVTGASFGNSLKNAFKSIAKYVSTIQIIYTIIRVLKGGVETVINLDTALVDLRKTTNATEKQLQSFYYESNKTAKALGVTTEQVISSAAEWSRLGYSIQDAERMAEVSSIMASISPGMDISTATDGLVSAMKAFNIEADDALDGIASKINAIGNTQAVNNEDIINFLTKSSAAMKEANNTLEETIALGTAATEITRDSQSVGNALKTMSMRIRGYDEETEEYIGGVEELSGTIADLTKTAENSNGISLFTDDSKTEYKSTTQLLREISEIYNDLTDKQQAGLLEALAGKRQGQVVAAILNNFQTVEKSLNTMKNSAGGAAAEMEIISDSLEYKLNALKETGTGIFQNLFQKEDIKVVIDLLTKLLEILDWLTDKLGLFGTALVGIGITAFIKNFA